MKFFGILVFFLTFTLTFPAWSTENRSDDFVEPYTEWLQWCPESRTVITGTRGAVEMIFIIEDEKKEYFGEILWTPDHIEAPPKYDRQKSVEKFRPSFPDDVPGYIFQKDVGILWCYSPDGKLRKVVRVEAPPPLPKTNFSMHTAYRLTMSLFYPLRNDEKRCRVIHRYLNSEMLSAVMGISGPTERLVPWEFPDYCVFVQFSDDVVDNLIKEFASLEQKKLVFLEEEILEITDPELDPYGSPYNTYFFLIDKRSLVFSRSLEMIQEVITQKKSGEKWKTPPSESETWTRMDKNADVWCWRRYTAEDAPVKEYTLTLHEKESSNDLVWIGKTDSLEDPAVQVIEWQPLQDIGLSFTCRQIKKGLLEGKSPLAIKYRGGLLNEKMVQPPIFTVGEDVISIVILPLFFGLPCPY